jgi:flagellar biogenesis protein FliO
MKRTLAAFALLGSLLAPELAWAKAVEDVRLDTDASDVIVTVVADETLAVPVVRTAPGSVRVRFYDAKDTRILRLNGDGSAVRAVDLTRGSDQTAALTINFGDRTKLAPADVRVESEGDTITLRIARGLLPAVRQVPGAPAVPAQAKTAPAPSPVAAKEPAAAPAPAASTVTVRTEEAKSPVASAAQPAAAEKGALGTKAVAGKSAEPELKLEQNSSSPMPILIAVTALLGLAYGGMQLMIRKKKVAGTEIPAIDVVAQRRIGPRHQLVIVRAFDRDYLLSVQGGQTTVVARSSRKRLEEAEALLTPLSQRRNDDLAARAFGDDDEPTFGGELFKNVLEERERARNDTASMRLERAYRDPTHGYGNTGLNSERREPTSSIKSERREPTSSIKSERRDPTAGMRLEAVRAESRAERERDEESVPAPPASSVSDSVSGLLRLRKQSGR